MPRKKTNLTMPVLALRGLMVFPHMVLHFDVGRPKSVAALQEAMMNDQKIFLVAQKDVDDPDPTPEKFVHRRHNRQYSAGDESASATACACWWRVKRAAN